MRPIRLQACKQLILVLALWAGGLAGGFHPVQAQSATAEEVLLTFRYPGVGNVYVTALYDRGDMFLPVTELFGLLYIHHEASPGDFSLGGTYLDGQTPYRISFAQYQVSLGGRRFDYTAEAFRIGELDFFLSPLVFEEVFGLRFTVNLNNLSLALESDQTLPVEERQERERARQRLETREVARTYYPLEYARNRRVMGMGFVDYTLNGTFTQDNPNMNYTLTGGVELFGGDLQGNVIGSYYNENHQVRSSNLRWRYVVRDSQWFSSFMAGQLSTTGLQPRALLGASFSNDPIEPRRLFEAYVVDGTTEPDSEVELFLNNRLIDFQRADASGYYRFEFPLTYGTSRLTINIYTPAGEVRSIDRQLQIPFTFLPPGEVAYNIQAGLLQGGDSWNLDGQRMAHGDVAVGLTGWLTAKVGMEYEEGETGNTPFTYGGLSARLFSQYLINLDLAPDALYRATASVMYPSSRSINLVYTHFTGPSRYNYQSARSELGFNVYTPFVLGRTSMGLRLSGEHTLFDDYSITRYRTDVNMRFGRTTARLGYRDLLYASDELQSMGQGQVSSSLTYTFQRTPGSPVFTRGMFLRGSLSYDLFYEQIDRAELQLSRSIRQTGRLIVAGGYDFLARQPIVQLGFTVDLNAVRSATHVDYRNETYAVRQNLRGSVGLDHRPERVLLDNREQVGRAGASVILFVDNNNSGSYDAGDEILPYRAVRLDRSAKAHLGRDGILRFSQLQSYYRYNLEVNRAALPNPTLVPAKDRFSFITDPNHFKRIEIPFYQSGIIDGTVFVERDGRRQGQGGLRLIVKGVGHEYGETIRNFFDGSFYAMELPPGRYTLEVDPAQLEFLGGYQEGGPLGFEVRALAEGDFVENLDVVIVVGERKAEGPEQGPAEPAEEPAPEQAGLTPEAPATHYIQTGLFPTYELAVQARQRAGEITSRPQYIKRHRGTGLYLLFSEPLTEDEALRLEAVLRENGLPEAFRRRLDDLPAGRPVHVQLRQFFTHEAATDFIREHGPALGFDLILDHYESDNRYVLRTDTLEDWERALELQQELNDHPALQPVIVIASGQ